MTRTTTVSLSGLLGLVLAFTAIGRTWAQETQPAASPTPQSAPQPSLPASPADALQPQSAPAAAPVAKGKKAKQEYTGPMTLVVLPPTPMLDEEGKQRQDPDGKLMYNPPVKQQRDKKGHPLFDAQGKPVMQTKDHLGYDEDGKKLHAAKEKPPKLISVSISRGTLTVDGMTGKAALNYEIKDLKYVYFYVPGIGTTIVSNGPFPGAIEQKNAFDDKTLTVTVGEHIMQLSSDKRLLGKKPESAFVLVDKSFSVSTKFPVVGYGPIRVAPYAWPGSRQEEELKGAVEPPPLPANLLPVLLLQPCPAGQMRMAGPPALPGQTAPPQPCVPISQGVATAPGANQTAANTQSRK